MKKETLSSDISVLPEQGGMRWKWLRRLGVGGFLFFLVKGLLWLLVPSLLAHWCTS